MTFGMNKILIAFTETAVSVFGVYFKLQSFVFMPVFGVTNALVPIVGYNYGARSSQRIQQAMTDKATGSGKVSAADVANKVFDAIEHDQFYVFSHPKALGNVKSRMDAIVEIRNPPDPFAERPEIGVGLRAALRGEAA